MNYGDLKLPKLSRGAHEAGSGELCIMEAIAYIEREPHSDMPKCASPVVAKFCQGINDCIPNERRDELWQFAVRIAGTASPEHDQARAEYLAMAAVNKFAVMACAGRIDQKLVDAMRDAKTLGAARAAAAAATADAAAAGAYAAAAGAYAAAARADADAYAAAARAADAAAGAARAADAAAGAAAYAAATAAVWDCALEVLNGLLEIGNTPSISWDKVSQVDWGELVR